MSAKKRKEPVIGKNGSVENSAAPEGQSESSRTNKRKRTSQRKSLMQLKEEDPEQLELQNDGIQEGEIIG
jgi:hypothetical protein